MKQKSVPNTPAPRFLSLKDSDIEHARQLLREVCSLTDLALGMAGDAGTVGEDAAQLRRRLKVMAALLGQAGWVGYLGLRRLESDEELVDSARWTGWPGRPMAA